TLRYDTSRHLKVNAIFPPWMLLTRLDPMNLLRQYTVFMLKETAQPHGGSHTILRHAHALAPQILRPLDARSRIHENAAVAKRSRGKHRDRNERSAAPRGRGQKGAHGKLRRVELFVLHHAPENLFHRQHEIVKVYALGLDDTVLERPHAIVVFACQRKVNTSHGYRSASDCLRLSFLHSFDELLDLFTKAAVAFLRQQTSQVSAAETDARHPCLNVFLNIGEAHPARDHEPNIRKRPLHLFDEVGPAHQVRGKNFHKIGTHAASGQNFRRCRGARETSNTGFVTKRNQIQFQRGGNDKTRARFDRPFPFLLRKHRTGTHVEIITQR